MGTPMSDPRTRCACVPTALENPRFTQAIDEMQREPEAAIRKYRNDPAVSTMLQDFLGFMGSHFEEVVLNDACRCEWT